MQAIALALQNHEEILALLATGSAGLNPEFMDEYSDLDLMIVTTGKAAEMLLEDLLWLDAVHRIAYRYRYNDDCYKLFFSDGIFCELLVIHVSQLPALEYSGASVVWARPSFDQALCAPHGPEEHDTDWLLQELLTVLYTGLCKYRRGEILAATGYVEGQVRDIFARLVTKTFPRSPHIPQDVFAKERRFEIAYPTLKEQLPAFFQGYAGIAQSAAYIMSFLEERFKIDPFIKQEIHALIDGSN
jgi:hypothetical protein